MMTGAILLTGGKRTRGRRALAVATVTSLLLCWAPSLVGQASKPSGAGDSAQVAAQELTRHAHRAREAFLEGRRDDAVAELRQAAAVIAREAAQQSGGIREHLERAAADLRVVADLIATGAELSPTQMNVAFARAHYWLAEAHWLAASQRWADQKLSSAGDDLRAAVRHLENAEAWVSYEASPVEVQAMRDARVLAGRLIEGIGSVPERMGEAYTAVGKAIEAFGKSLEASGPARRRE